MTPRTGTGRARISWRRSQRVLAAVASAILLACADGPAPPSRAGTAPVLATTPGRTSTLGPPEPSREPPVRGALTLGLALEKGVVIEGESIPFALTLRNGSSQALTFAQPSAELPVWGIRVATADGRAVTGDPTSLAAREGERTEPARSPRTVALAPGASHTLRGDVLAWIGALAPGSYTITASWDGPPPLRAESKGAALRVGKATPARLREGGHNVFLARAARDAAWLNRDAGGYDLFLLRSSASVPDVVRSSRPVAHLEGAADAVPASYNSGTLDARVVAWVESGSTLRLVRVPDDGGAVTAGSARLPFEGMALVEPPFVDERGSLLSVVATRDGKSAALARVASDRSAAFTPLHLPAPMGTLRAAAWCPDGTLAVVWQSGESGDLSAASARLASLPAAIEGRKLASLPGKPAALRLGCRSHESDDGYDLVVFALRRDPDALVERRLDFRTGRVEAERRVAASASAAVSVLDAAVGQDVAARYLLAGSAGEVSVLEAGDRGLVPVKGPKGEPVRDGESPQLVLGWRPGAKVSTWVRYVASGGRLTAIEIR